MKFIEKDSVRFLKFDIFPQEIIHGVFTRIGGLSPDPWDSLNVGGTVGDDLERVRENRYRSFEILGRSRLSIFDVWQVHSADIVIANLPHKNNPPKHLLKADVIITDNPIVSLFMRFADCTPILLFDPVKRAIGLAHAGWSGTVKDAAGECVRGMKAAYGSKAENILAAIGPSIGPDHYEVGKDVIDYVNYTFRNNSSEVLIQHGGITRFNLWAANELLLRQAGVKNIEIAGICTMCHQTDWFSHRGQRGKTGRFGALISMRE